jgi:hypothetical protein
MNIILTVLYEEPYWVGLFERQDNDNYYVAKCIFGKEPSMPEVYEVITKNYSKLKFSKPIKNTYNVKKKVNPKRKSREVAKLTTNKGISTKAQQALKQEYEKNKKERKIISKEVKERILLEKRLKKVEKKKQKKKGH